MRFGKYIAYLILCCNFITPVFGADEGADTFFLLDVNKDCLTNAHILGKNGESLDYAPVAPIDESQMAVFRNAPSNTPNSPNNLAELKKHADDFFAKYDRPSAKQYYEELMKRLTPSALIKIIDAVLKDEEALKKIAKDSYHHVTDFTKIVLVEGEKPHAYKVRLHLWWPGRGDTVKKLAVEDKHVHKWDFTSRMFAGKFENQIFTTRKITPDEQKIHDRFIDKINKMSPKDQKRIFESLNMIEMALFKKSMYNQKKYLCQVKSTEFYTLPEILQKLGMTAKELRTVIAVYERYVTEPNVTGKYGLRKIGLEALKPPALYEISDGTVYVERYQLAHRLISDPEQITATLVVTAPPIKEMEPYLLMREETGESLTKEAPKLSVEELKKELKKFSEYLKSRQQKEKAPTEKAAMIFH